MAATTTQRMITLRLYVTYTGQGVLSGVQLSLQAPHPLTLAEVIWATSGAPRAVWYLYNGI